MVVNFEFLGNEPIENVVTCLNYAVDKVIYFGYSEAIREALLDIFCSDYDDDGEPVMMNVPPSFLPKKDVKKMLKDKCCKTEENYETMEFMKIMQFASTKETINITIE